MRLNHRGHRGSPANTVKHLVALFVSLCSLWLIVFLFAASIGERTKASALHSLEGLEMPVQERARVRPPELSGGCRWPNTGKPHSLSALKSERGLDRFLSYCYINLMNILPA